MCEATHSARYRARRARSHSWLKTPAGKGAQTKTTSEIRKGAKYAALIALYAGLGGFRSDQTDAALLLVLTSIKRLYCTVTKTTFYLARQIARFSRGLTF